MSTAEGQCPGTVHHGQGCGRRRSAVPGPQRQHHQQRSAGGQQRRAGGAAHPVRARDRGADRRDRDRPAPDRGAECDREQLGVHARQQQHQHGGAHRQCGARAVRAQRLRHPPDGLRDHRHGHELQGVQRPGAGGQRAVLEPHREQRHRHGRGQGEADPGGQGAPGAGARQTDRQSDLAAGRPGQKLAQGDQIGVGGVVQPATSLHELGPKIPQVCHWPPERGEPEPQERPKHLRHTAAGDRRRRLWVLRGDRGPHRTGRPRRHRCAGAPRMPRRRGLCAFGPIVLRMRPRSRCWPRPRAAPVGAIIRRRHGLDLDYAHARPRTDAQPA